MVRLDSPLPLVVGAGGHRDLRDEDAPALAARLREALDDLQQRHPHTALVLLSSLAEGADRLAARVALDLGCRLVVPLPLPADDYEKDFAAAGSVEEFRALRARAAACLVVPADPGRDRDHHYARAAAWIAHRSQAVIACWDGRPARGEAGTGTLVRFALEGVPEGYGEPRTPLDAVERRPVLHIVTPRRRGGAPDGALGVRWLYPDGYGDRRAAERAFARLWTRVDELNRDACAHPAEGHGLLPPPATALDGDLAAIDRGYRTADALSVRHQRLTRRTLGGILILAFVAALALQVGQLLPRAPRAVNAVYVGALALAYAWWFWAHRGRHQTRHLDYRALAEGLRVQFFWRLAGLEGSAADHYLRKQRGELDWIRRALRAWDLGPTPAPPPDGTALAARHWVSAQAAYFASAARENDGRARLLRRGGYVFFGAALLLGAVRLLGADNHPVLVLVGLVPVVGALCQAYGDKRALAPLAKQYGRMGLVFAHAEDALAASLAAGDRARALAILRELGVEALAENADWVILHRERPVQVPGAK